MIATLGVRPVEVRPPDLRRGLRASFWRNAVSRCARSWTAIKRASDVLLGAALIVAAAPLCAAVALAIKLTSPGPAFFVQERVGVVAAFSSFTNSAR